MVRMTLALSCAAWLTACVGLLPEGPDPGLDQDQDPVREPPELEPPAPPADAGLTPAPPAPETDASPELPTDSGTPVEPPWTDHDAGEPRPDAQPGPPLSSSGIPLTMENVLEISLHRCDDCHDRYADDGQVRARLLEMANPPGMPYVKPGDVEGSYLWHKVMGTQESVGGGGSRMPFARSLDGAQLLFLREWIEAGAPE